MDTQLMRKHLESMGRILRSHEIGLRDDRELREAISDQLYSFLLTCQGNGILDTLENRHMVKVVPAVP